MLQALFIIIVIMLAAASIFFLRRQQPLRRWQQEPRRRDIINALSELYAPIQSTLTAKQGREHAGLHDFSYTYGEIDFWGFTAILSQIHIQPGWRFYDLGSGAGKAVLLTAMLHPDVDCTGIEIIPELVELSQSLQRKTKIKNAHFIAGDFFDHDISDADVIFVNATGFFGDLLSRLQNHLSNTKPGCTIILSSKTLPSTHFDTLYEGQAPMSWGPCTLNIFIRRG